MCTELRLFNSFDTFIFYVYLANVVCILYSFFFLHLICCSCLFPISFSLLLYLGKTTKKCAFRWMSWRYCLLLLYKFRRYFSQYYLFMSYFMHLIIHTNKVACWFLLICVLFWIARFLSNWMWICVYLNAG